MYVLLPPHLCLFHVMFCDVMSPHVVLFVLHIHSFAVLPLRWGLKLDLIYAQQAPRKDVIFLMWPALQISSVWNVHWFFTIKGDYSGKLSA